MKRFSWRKLAMAIAMVVAAVPMLLFSIDAVALHKYRTFIAPALLYPNADELEREDRYGGVELLLATADDTETVLSYYESYLKEAGWTLEERVGTRMVMSYRILRFEKPYFEGYYRLSNDPVYALRIQLHRQPSGMAYIEIGYGKIMYM